MEVNWNVRDVNLVDISGTNISKVWKNSNKITLKIFGQEKINLRSVTSLEGRKEE
jgi:hypothetical protein